MRLVVFLALFFIVCSLAKKPVKKHTRKHRGHTKHHRAHTKYHPKNHRRKHRRHSRYVNQNDLSEHLHDKNDLSIFESHGIVGGFFFQIRGALLDNKGVWLDDFGGFDVRDHHGGKSEIVYSKKRKAKAQKQKAPVKAKAKPKAKPSAHPVQKKKSTHPVQKKKAPHHTNHVDKYDEPEPEPQPHAQIPPQVPQNLPNVREVQFYPAGPYYLKDKMKHPGGFIQLTEEEVSVGTVKTKSIIDELCSQMEAIPDDEVQAAVQELLKYIRKVLQDGYEVKIDNFGVFTSVFEEEETIEDPVTGKDVFFPEGFSIDFESSEPFDIKLAEAALAKSNSTPNVGSYTIGPLFLILCCGGLGYAFAWLKKNKETDYVNLGDQNNADKIELPTYSQ